MSSIFDLKHSVEELSSANQGISRMDYTQYPPTRSVVNDAFHNGSINFRWQTSGNKWWCPSRSYIRMRLRITKGDGVTQLDKSDDIAPNMGLCSALFQNAEFRMNGKTVSRISDYMPQIDALDNRINKSRSWLKSVGDVANFWDDDYSNRQSAITSDGYLLREITDNLPGYEESRTALGFDPAGVADNNAWAYDPATGNLVYDQGANANGLTTAEASVAFPVGSYFRFVDVDGVPGKPAKILTNDGAGNLNVGVNGLGTTAVNGTINFAKAHPRNENDDNKARKASYVELIYQPPLSIFKVPHAIPGGATMCELVLNPQTESVYQQNAIQSSLGASKVPGTDFKVNVENMYLYVNTVEGPRVDNTTYYLDLDNIDCQADNVPGASFQQRNFEVSPSTTALTVAYQHSAVGNDTKYSQSIFKGNDNNELKVVRFYVNYAGQSLPNPDANPEFKDGTDFTVQRYMETQINTGSMFDTGGSETIDEWHNRGAYYFQTWCKDGTDRSTRVSVHQGFEVGTAVNDLRVLLFSHSKQVARIRIEDGRTVDVQLEDQ